MSYVTACSSRLVGMIIRVQASHEAHLPPQRGTVIVDLRLEGPVKAPVVEAMTNLIGKVSHLVAQDHHPKSGPITWFSQSQVQNSSHRPWNKDGKIKPLIYTSAADLKVKFSDFRRLMEFIETVSPWEGVNVKRIEWTLTESAKNEALERTQKQAVENAIIKARRYAEAAGFHNVTPIMIADVGLLVAGSTGSGGSPASAVYRTGAGTADSSFQPEDVVVTASVEVELEAG